MEIRCSPVIHKRSSLARRSVCWSFREPFKTNGCRHDRSMRHKSYETFRRMDEKRYYHIKHQHGHWLRIAAWVLCDDKCNHRLQSSSKFTFFFFQSFEKSLLLFYELGSKTVHSSEWFSYFSCKNKWTSGQKLSRNEQTTRYQIGERSRWPPQKVVSLRWRFIFFFDFVR